MSEVELYKRKLAREKAARKEAERIMEAKSVELYDSNQELQKIKLDLEHEIKLRTKQLEEFSAAAEDNPSPVLQLSYDGIIQFANESGQEILSTLGYEINHDIPIEWMRPFELAVANGLPEESELGVGEDRVFNFLFIASEVLKLVTIYGKEVTEVKAGKDRLIASEKKYRGILENMKLGLVEILPDGSIVRAYPEFCRLSDYTEEQLKLKNFKDFLIVDKFDAMRAFQICLMEESSGTLKEFTLSLSKGIEKRVVISSSCVFLEEGVKGFALIIADISPQVAMQEELVVAKEAAESASKAKSEFLANMSHEIRTPLNAILGLSEVLRDKSVSNDFRDKLNIILSSGETLLAIINSILDLAKIEAGRLDMVLEPISLRELVIDTLNVFKHKAESKGLSISHTFNSDSGDLFLLDETRIRQILFNLVGNAIKFTSDGYVTLGVFVEDLQYCSSCNITFEVTDTGIGIPKAQQEMIFESFKQQTGQSNREYGGTGLGLTITKKLTEHLGGKIEIESEEGKGATFRIVLPDVEQASTTLDSTTSITVDLENIVFDKAKILVVDDVEFNLEVIKGMLTPYKFQLCYARDGYEAIDRMVLEKPDLVIMDVRMPNLTGDEATRRARDIESIKNIPVIVCTASVLQSDLDTYKDIFDGYIPKPVTKDHLFHEVMRFVNYRMEVRSSDEPEQNRELEAENIPTEVMQVLPVLVEILEGDCYKNWEKLTHGLVIFEIEEFVQTLQEVNGPYGIKMLDHYCDTLKRGIDSFDLEVLDVELQGYPKIVDNIKKLIL